MKKELVRYEGNLAQYPIFSRKRRKGKKWGKFTFPVKNKKGKYIREGKLTIEGPIGELGPMAQDLWVLILSYFDKEKYPEKIGYSIYEMAKDLGLSYGGKTVKRIRKNLVSLWKTGIHFEGLFWDRTAHIDAYFHLINSLIFYDYKTDPQKGIPSREAREINIITIDPDLRKSIEKGYYKLIDSKLYFDLPSGLPRSIYIYLEKKGLWSKGKWIEGVKSFANYLGLKQDQDTYHLERTITSGITPLKKKGLLTFTILDHQVIINLTHKQIEEPKEKEVKEPEEKEEKRVSKEKVEQIIKETVKRLSIPREVLGV